MLNSSEFFEVERLISSQPTAADIKNAGRSAVRKVLAKLTPDETATGLSISDLIDEISANSETQEKRAAATHRRIHGLA